MDISAHSPTRHRFPIHRYSYYWFAIASATFVVSTIVAIVQMPRPRDPYDAVRLSTVEGWLQPIEPKHATELDQIQADLNAMWVSSDGREIWVAGNSGTIARSTDGGVNWRKLPDEAPQVQQTTQPAPAATTETAATDTVITDTVSIDTSATGTLSSETSGTTGTTATSSSFPSSTRTRLEQAPPIAHDFFELIPSAHAQEHDVTALPKPAPWPRDADLISIENFKGNTFVALASIGDLWITNDRGATWFTSDQTTFPLSPSAKIPFRSFTGIASQIFVDRNGNAYQRFPFSRPIFSGNVNAIVTTEGGGQLALANNGRIFNGYQNVWTAGIETPVKADLYGGYPVGTRMYIVGAHGTMLWIDGPAYAVLHPPTDADLRAIVFINENTGFAAGSRGVVLKTTDGGRTWRHLTREWNPAAKNNPGLPVPPPWYFLFNAFVTVPALAVATRSRPRDRSTPTEESVTDAISSDQPLEKGQPDAMNLNAIALAMSRFLRNENTVPPLTIAITGEWGSGKSSLMNLLKADLVDFGFRPVWFNAWHNQKEEHLLATLLQSIRLQALPHWWRPENLVFRARLIWIRGWKHRVNVLLLFLLIALGIGYDMARHHHNGPLEPIDAAIEKALKSPLELVTETGKARDELALILSFVGIVTAFYKGLSAFGMNPAKLVSAISGSAKVSDLSAQMSFRHRFAGEFRDVTEALGPRSLLIFIDDLDRCQPASVNEVLEAVNFLMTAGNCYVVLGIDRGRVERYLKVSFKEAAADEPDFAANYLDKLINIEVPVPAMEDAQCVALLTTNRPPVEEPTWQVRAWRATARVLAFWPLVAAALLCWAAFLAGERLSSPQEQIQPTRQTSAASVVVTPGSAGSGNTTPSTPQPTRPRQPGIIAHGTPRVHMWMIAWAVLLLIPLGSVGWWLITRKADLIVHDSADFVTALQIWYPLIIARNRTPRSLKRFMNRLRYLAMRQRPQHESPTFWRSFSLKARATEERAESANTKSIPEPVLVALASVYSFGRTWLNDLDRPDTNGPPEGTTPEIWRLFTTVRAKHFAHYPGNLASFRNEFVRILADVRVS